MPSICRLSTCMLTYGKPKTTKVSEAQAQVRPTSYCPAAQFCAQHAVHEFGGQSTHTQADRQASADEFKLAVAHRELCLGSYVSA